MVVICCKCERVRKGTEWVALERPLAPEYPVSHGYCPVCAAAAFEEIHAMCASDPGGFVRALPRASNQ